MGASDSVCTSHGTVYRQLGLLQVEIEITLKKIEKL